MKRRMAVVAIVLGALSLYGVAFAPTPVLAQSKDGLLGQWTLARGKSDFQPDSTLQSRTWEFVAKDGGVGFTQKTVTDRGNTVEIDFTAKYDGKDVPITGSQLDTVALKKVDATTIERTAKIQGKPVETVTMKLSADGKTLTVTTKGVIDGDAYSSTQVFEKQ
jgi:hypothetical protein